MKTKLSLCVTEINLNGTIREEKVDGPEYVGL